MPSILDFEVEVRCYTLTRMNPIPPIIIHMDIWPQLNFMSLAMITAIDEYTFVNTFENLSLSLH